MEPNRIIEVALEAARAGGEVLKKYHSGRLEVEFKGKIDPVTIADKTSQKVIAEIISRNFPGHAFIGEEDQMQGEPGEYTWIVDPLDGTVNFVHGLPIFCVSIGVMHRDELIAGVIHAPVLGETFVAEKGKGVRLNGEKASVSGVDALLRSLAVTGFSYDIHNSPEVAVTVLGRVLEKVQGIRRLGSAALDLAYVACGRFEVFWEEGLSPWDVAAGALMVAEAGGKVTDFRGGDDYVFGKSILATNGAVHQDVLRLLECREQGT